MYIRIFLKTPPIAERMTIDVKSTLEKMEFYLMFKGCFLLVYLYMDVLYAGALEAN